MFMFDKILKFLYDVMLFIGLMASIVLFLAVIYFIVMAVLALPL